MSLTLIRKAAKFMKIKFICCVCTKEGNGPCWPRLGQAGLAFLGTRAEWAKKLAENGSKSNQKKEEK